MNTPKVGIIMGSKSDLGVMKEAAQVLEEFGIEFKLTVLSAHRTPHMVMKFAETAREKGIGVIIAGAGMAAHLPGVIAAFTTLPVIGVPVMAANSPSGLDSALAIMQMPPGIPVATVALNGARNAGILAAEIIAVADQEIREKLRKFRETMRKKAEDLADEIEKGDYKKFL
jgi:5-(carboxyamino)imidazole ribonucleotide mutase